MSAARVVVTGVGMISGLGADAQSTWQAVLAGRTGIRPIARWDVSRYSARLAAVTGQEEVLAQFSARRRRKLDYCHCLAIVAARQALADSTSAPLAIDPRRAGLFVGTSLGGMLSGQRYLEETLVDRPRRRPLLHRYPFHVLVDELTRETGFLGPRSIVSTACTASTIALIEAFDAVRYGEADLVLAGGVDPLSRFTLAGFGSMQNVAMEPCAPFSTPEGLTLGEGAGFLVLESRAYALARGARIYCELLGCGLNADAYHATSPDPSGNSQRRVFEDALRDANLTIDAIDYVNVHGTGTATNDAVESRNLEALFGSRVRDVPVSSIKGAIGHTLGAAGAIEAIHTVLAIHSGDLPPTANFTTPREGCGLDYVPNRSRAHAIRAAVTQNYAFGGNNATIAFARNDFSAGGGREDVDRTVVVTGLGIISPIGNGVVSFTEALRRVDLGIREVAQFDHGGGGARQGAVIADFQPERYTRANTRRLDRLSQLTVAAAELALADCGLRITRDNAFRVGLVVGTMNGPVGSCEAFYRDVVLGDPRRANPIIFPSTVFNAGIGQASISLRARGCNVATTLGQASGLHALAQAYSMVRHGRADVIIAGGVDELIPSVVAGHAVARTLSPLVRGGLSGQEAMRPFDRRRNGMILGEGAGFLVLESLEHARVRGARILGRIEGAAVGADRPGPLGWDESGESLAANMMAASGSAMDGIDLVAACALGHPVHDGIFAAAINRAFGGRRVPVMALTSLFGVSGAASSLAACAALVGLREGFIPSGSGSDDLDPGCAIDLVDGAIRKGNVDRTLLSAVSLGGSNVSLVLRREAAQGAA